MLRSKSIHSAWILFGLASTGFFLCIIGAILFSLVLSGCNAGTGPAPGPDVSGHWAGSFDYSGRAFLYVQWITPGGAFRDSLAMDGAPVMVNLGTWKVSGDQFIAKNSECQEPDAAGKLALVPCGAESDSTLIDIRGNAWTQSAIVAGQVMTVQFLRIGK
jgi:hypothetical protein